MCKRKKNIGTLQYLDLHIKNKPGGGVQKVMAGGGVTWKRRLAKIIDLSAPAAPSLFLPSFAFSILLKVVEKLHVYTQQQQQSRGGDERAMIYIFLFTRMINYRRWQKPRAATAAVLFSSTFDQLGLEINRISCPILLQIKLL